MSTLVWNPLTDADLPALSHLARRCLEKDGGLPLLTTEPMLRQLFLSGQSLGGRDETGDLVAAGSVFVDATGHRAATGLVHPSARQQGLGEELVRWALERSGGTLLRLVAETTSPESDALAGRLGLRRTFAEHVMRHPLVEIPKIARPKGAHTHPWTDDTAGLFHAAYTRSFSTRPGFPGTPLDEWVSSVAGDNAFRPDLSRVVLDDEGHVVGFVTISDDWIDQVGVVPDWRGRRLGAHLVVRSLRALRKAGCEQAWLAVNVDNPSAHELYLRLGFVDHGQRARYQQTAPVESLGGAGAIP